MREAAVLPSGTALVAVAVNVFALLLLVAHRLHCTKNPSSSAILYKSLKQLQISKSSTESELISLKEAVQNIILCAELMQELDKTLKLFPITVRQDNASAISLVNNPVVNRQGRSKFINRALFSGQ